MNVLDDLQLADLEELERDRPGLVHVGTYDLDSPTDRAVYLDVVNNRLGASNVELQDLENGRVVIVHHRQVTP